MVRLVSASCLLALLLGAASAGATSVLRYTWGDPSGVVLNQDWAGPQTYTQTLTVTGLTGQVTRIHVTLWTNMVTPQAWYMTINGAAPANDCLGHPAFFASPAVAGAQALPGATLSAVGWWFGITSPRPRIELDVTLDPPFTADPGTRYAIATLTFDHANSATGTAYPPTACGDADQPFCFVVNYPWYGRADYTVVGMALEQDAISWQNAAGTTDCHVVVPVKPTSWGQLKSIYR